MKNQTGNSHKYVICIHSASKQYTHIWRSTVTIDKLEASEFTLQIYVPNI